LQQYIDKSFHMFSRKNIRIRIKFHASLVNVVLDRFGKDANIRKVNDEAFILSTQAKLSDGLINWILTWGSRAKVLSRLSRSAGERKDQSNVCDLSLNSIHLTDLEAI